MTIGLWLNAVVAGLLVITIIYAARLNRRLGNLRDGRAELEKAVAEFASAAQAAEASVEKLKQGAGSRQSDLEERIDSGRALRDELVFLADRAEDQAKRLEALIREGRQADVSLVPTASSAPAVGESGVPETPEVRTEAETALLRTLAGLR